MRVRLIRRVAGDGHVALTERGETVAVVEATVRETLEARPPDW